MIRGDLNAGAPSPEACFLKGYTDHRIVSVYVAVIACKGLPTHINGPGVRLDFASQFLRPFSVSWDDHGITTYMSFNRVWTTVVIPWSAVAQIEVRSSPSGEPTVLGSWVPVMEPPTDVEPAPPPPKRPALRLVRDGDVS